MAGYVALVIVYGIFALMALLPLFEEAGEKDRVVGKYDDRA
jgi:hypothetical protein